MAGGGDRTEQPTPKRLREARRKGQIAVSRDLTSSVAFAAAVAALWMTWGSLRSALGAAIIGALDRSTHTVELTSADVVAVLTSAVQTMIRAALPVGLAALVGAATTALLQTRGHLSAAQFVPKPDRFDPVKGISRLFALRTTVELAKTWGRLALVGVAVGSAVMSERGALSSAFHGGVHAAVAVSALLAKAAVARAVVLLVALGGVDVLLQRWLHERELRMTKDEVRRDHREDEGDPHVKQARKQAHREIAVDQMLAATRTASFVAVNPTHLAVAIAYDPERDNAPRVVARGAGRIARRIRRTAEGSGIAVIQNRPLARALFRLPVETEIPEALFGAVADVLAFVEAELHRRGRGTSSDQPPNTDL